MTPETFDEVVRGMMEQSSQVLLSKAKEYATGGDRLHNFRLAAELNDQTMEQACWGFATKHLISVVDMVKSGDVYPMEVWDEKLGDLSNYLYLLKAIVVERNAAAGGTPSSEMPDVEYLMTMTKNNEKDI